MRQQSRGGNSIVRVATSPRLTWTVKAGRRRARTRASVPLWLLVLLLSTTACAGRSQPATAPAASTGAVAQTASQSTAVDALCENGRGQLLRGEYASAADTLDRCIAADPNRAYAYYQAGLAYNEIDRADLMIIRFEAFVRLAPDAPERPRVESILQTVRR